MERETNIFDYIYVLVKWRKFILVNFLVICVLAAGISLILPRWYTATTTIMPPEEQQFGLGLTSMLANLPLGGGTIPGLTTPGTMYLAILDSRSVKEGVVTKQNLIEVYKAEHMEEAVKKLSKKTDMSISDEGVIELKATARTARRAADIANAYIEELDRKNIELNIAQARNNRIFIEERLEENKAALRKAEEDLKNFQETYKAISLPEQTAAAIAAAALVMGEMQTLEIQRDVLLATMKPTNPKVVQLKTQIEAMRKQLDRMEYGSNPPDAGDDTGESNSRLYVPFSDVPAVGLDLARLTREFKIQEVIFELLTQQYEQARIQEAKDTPSVQVLDRAVPPEIRSKPIRSIIVLFSGGVSLVLSLLFIAWVEYIRKLRIRSPEEYGRMQGVVTELKKDLKYFLRKRS